MNGDILVPMSMFLAIFGVVYLYLSTRNKERLALIEKGVDASIFMNGGQDRTPFYKVILLNLALLLMGIGVGVYRLIISNLYFIKRERIVSSNYFHYGRSLFVFGIHND